MPYTSENVPSFAVEALGRSEAFLDFQERLSRVAPVNRPVLLLGERGTGKELAASRLHFLSGRWQGPLVTLNCATLSPGLIEAELFGHEKGAFTGADQRKTGRFEAANGGTLFLDEIGSIPLVVQEKILRVVEYGSFARVGSSTQITVDVRIVGATNVDLAALADRDAFKRDLLDRLSFEVLFLPPIRHRGEDLMLLADHFATRMAFELGRKEIPVFTPRAVAALQGYQWPGNVRELKNVVERAVYRAEGEVIDAVVFDPFVSPYAALLTAEPDGEGAGEWGRDSEAGGRPPSAGPVNLAAAVAALEVDLLRQALQACRHHQRRAAEWLGLSYDQFRGRLRKYQEELFAPEP